MLLSLEFWKTRKSQNALLIFAVVLVFILVFCLNFLTPLISDDYKYSFNLVDPLKSDDFSTLVFNLRFGERVSSFQDVLESQYNHYYAWGGRTVAHTLAQTFLWVGRPIFIVANTIAYVLLTWVLFKHIMVGFTVKYPVIIYFFVNIFIWFFAPVIGETLLWTTGACNYLWGGLFIFSYLLPYRYMLTQSKPFKNVIFVPVMLLAGIVAGWCNENTSGMGLLIAISFVVLYYLQHKRIPAWAISGIIGAAIGLALLVGAPGNYARAEITETQGFFAAVTMRLSQCFKAFSGSMQPLFVIAIVCLTVLFLSNTSKLSKMLSGIYFLGALACNFAMMLSPAYPTRAQFGVFLPLAISALTATIGICEMPCEKRELLWVKRVAATSIIAVSAFLFSASYVVGLAHAGKNWLEYNAREQYILQQKANNNLNITVSAIKSTHPYSPFYELADVPAARYYGVESITVLPSEDAKLQGK